MFKILLSALKTSGKWLLSVADSMSRAKAAAELTRQGLHKEAKSLMMK